MKVTTAMLPTSSRRSLPYSVKMPRPLLETAVNTSPSTPKGASWMTHLTVMDTISARSTMTLMVLSAFMVLKAMPPRIAQKRMPM